MWSIIRAIVQGIVSAVLEFFQKQAEKPKVTYDADTPSEIKSAVESDILDKLRDEPGSGDPH